MKWATRAGMHIDRSACAWLIRRFLDSDAEFVFVADPAGVPPAAIAFDIRGAELSHHGSDCSFETILRRYELAAVMAASRAAEYTALIAEAEAALGAEAAARAAALRRLRGELRRITRRDYFPPAAREQARAAVETLADRGDEASAVTVPARGRP